ncbi:hypothetical protein KTAU_03160 [Thermogemmatispora aurantia]|jgi:predicted transcriptional regulator|uniref:Uncharacterized protein n=1 Tax=Thermogemmatispora aurantia TaxID=2045279 RepID=A0A5J4JVJ6_9CHLR|nr:hypothetical protein [Thermogemmatispora aurantia]GER81678.1 hypothetical protein KTAU_03160 [Thermogemmatispora aurantia]
MLRAWGLSKYLKHAATRAAPILLTSPAAASSSRLERAAAADTAMRGELHSDVYFRALPEAARPEIISQLDRRERLVFLLLNGKRSLSEIARLVHRDEQDVACTVARLLRSGYVEHIEDDTAPARAGTPVTPLTQAPSHPL